MKLTSLVSRNLCFYWRTNLAIVAGVAIATAVLSGALLVGRSVRGSLRTLLFQRIGSTDYALTSTGFFGEHLAESFSGVNTSPIISLHGVVVRESTRVRAHDVNVYGVDARFWNFHNMPGQSSPTDRSALIGAPLARQLQIRTGDSLLLRIETQQSIPREWLYGRRDTVGRTIRLTCSGILPESSLGEFALRPSQGDIFSIFVPLNRLQKDLEQPSRVNGILLSRRDARFSDKSLRDELKKNCTLADLGLKLRNLDSGKGFSLESSRIILDDRVADAAMQAAAAAGINSSPVYTYLANSIRAKGREIPYSVISAADIGIGALKSISGSPSGSPAASSEDSIWLTDWASRDLGAAVGDAVEVDYYLWQESGQLVTRTARFRLAGIVSLSTGIDASFAPEIPGITEARSISAWDPPFPLDLGRIRREDEDFWNRYRATPKAFIPLSRGQALWQNRFGKTTAIRVSLPDGTTVDSGREQFTEALLQRIDPQQAGFSIAPVREQGLAASRGSTDFAEYFVYFSSFLIAAAILLSTLFFKLMIEQRVHEIGILRTTGFSIQKLRWILMTEGASLSLAGSLLGMAGASAYGWLMVFGLRTWWIGAVGTSRIQLHIAWIDLCSGAVAAILFSIAAIAWTLRGLRHNSPRALLTGLLESTAVKARRNRILAYAASISFAASVLLLIGSAIGKVAQLEAFFGSGSLLLISILCATAMYLRRTNPRPIQGNGWPAFFRFGLRNATHRPGRSLVCACLIASATFIVISMEAFRQDSKDSSLEIKSGTGGYPLVAESALPILHDLNTEAGHEATGLTSLEGINRIQFVPFRERPGDDASCLNLYAPQNPKILGAPKSFLAAGRFSFQDSTAVDDRQRANPWLLLESSSREPAIPAIADANTIQYILHRRIGDELTVRGDDGNPVRLRLVAALRDSVFQGELLISESDFVRVFPENQGYRFFLMNVPAHSADDWKTKLQETLSDWGFNVQSSRERLSAYHRVEDSYLSTFQSLGALGLILGTVGLATILLRNVLERRQELAILRASGYRRKVLSGIILSENVVLVLWGLASGAVCAFLAILPALQSRGASFPLISSILVLLAVFATGLVSSIFAVIAALRSPLLSSLRSE